MQPDRIRALFGTMRDDEEGIGNFVLDALHKVMIGRSLEAAVPVLEEAHARMAGGEVRLADGRVVRTLDCPEGPHGGVWRKFLSVSGGGMAIVTALEVDGEPDPKLDAALDMSLGKGASRRRREPGPCDAVTVYVARDEREVEAAVAANVAGAWSHLEAFGTRASIGPHDPSGGWLESSRTVNGPGLDIWPSYFGSLRLLFGATGLDGAAAASAERMGARRWDGTREATDYGAARTFGNEIAAEDGYLPSAHCLEALSELGRLGAEAAVPVVCGELARLADALRSHPGICDRADGGFSANDGRNTARLLEDGDETVLSLGDQNNDFLVALSASMLRILSVRTQTDRTCLNLVFDLAPDGAASLRGAMPLGMEATRSWNSLKSGAATLALCAGEETASPGDGEEPAPAP